jgi:hypothetical protein
MASRAPVRFLVGAIGLSLAVGHGVIAAQEKAAGPDGEKVGRLLQPLPEPSPERDLDRLQRRLADLSARSREAETGAGALETARRALRAARRLRESGKIASAERAVEVADAALLLADRLLAERDARLAVGAALRKAERVETEAARAREALEAAMRQRADLQAGSK